MFVFAGKFGGDTVGSVTYGGQPLEQLGSVDEGSVHLELRGLLNPPVGTATLAWSKTGSNQNVTWGYSIYSGVDQSNPFGAPNGNCAARDSPTPKSINVVSPRAAPSSTSPSSTTTASPAAPPRAAARTRWSTHISTTQGGSSDQPGSCHTAVTWTPANGSGTVDWAIAAFALQPAP